MLGSWRQLSRRVAFWGKRFYESSARTGHRLLWLGLVLNLFLAPVRSSQAAAEAADRDQATETEAGVHLVEGGRKVVYTAAFFGRFSPVTARDILRQIPGMTSVSRRGGRQGRRGFSSNTDRILINGRRAAGKGNDGESRLAAIPADQVVRVEVVRELSEELSASGPGLLVNFVLDSEADASGSWELEGRRYDGGVVRPGINLSSRRSTHSLTLQGDLEVAPVFRSRQGLERIAGPAGGLEGERVERRLTEGWEASVSGELAHAFGDDHRIQVDLLLSRAEQDVENLEDEFEPVGPEGLALDASTTQLATQRESEWEISADYQRAIGDGRELRLVVIHRNENEKTHTSKGAATGGRFAPEDREVEERRARETVLRPTLRGVPSPGHRIEVGLEAAINTLASELRVFDLVGAQLVEVPVADGSVRVREDRIEGFAAHDWSLGESTTLRSVLAVETSDLRQAGDSLTERSFTFVKPAFDLRHDLNPRNQLRLVVRRDVDQLDFENFVSSFDREDDEVDEGNPELRPQSSWGLTISAEHRLADDAGVLTAEAFYSKVRDVIDLGPTSDVDSVPTNIGSGHKLGLKAEASVRLVWLDLEGLLLTGRVLWQETSVVDPFDGRDRPFAGEPGWEYAVGLRHDNTTRGLAHGLDLSDQSATYRFDIEETDRIDRSASIDVFVEKQLGRKLRLRLTARNLLGNERTRRRETFADPLGERRLDSVEWRVRERGPEVRLTLRGLF